MHNVWVCVGGAVAAEKEFICDALPCALIGMNAAQMIESSVVRVLVNSAKHISENDNHELCDFVRDIV